VRDALEDYKRRNPMQQVRKMLENKNPLEQEDWFLATLSLIFSRVGKGT
jgi:hypothetical protein